MDPDRSYRILIRCIVIYFILCALCAGVVVYLPQKGGDPLYFFIDPLWNATDDPVLLFLIRTFVVVFAIALIPGMILVAFWVLLLVLTVSALAGLAYFLGLAALSGPTGAIIVFGSVGTLIWYLLLHRYRKITDRFAELVVEFVVSFFGEEPNPMNRLTSIERTLSPRQSFLACLFLAVAALVGAGYSSQGHFFISTSFLLVALLCSYGVVVSIRELSGIGDPQERKLHNQMAKLAQALDLPSIPHSFNQYDGFFEEIRKRAVLNSTAKTNQKVIALMHQTTTAYNEMVELKRAEAALKRLPKEYIVKDLQIEKEEVALRKEIAEHRRAIKQIIENPNALPPAPLPDDDTIIGR
jgi:hypothetical protein